MGSYDREYMRDDFDQSSIFGGMGGRGPKSWSMVTWIIVVNVAIFVGQSLANTDPFKIWWAPLQLDSITSGLLWTPISHMFFHFGIFHLLANMLGLFFVGRALEQLVGVKRFLIIYLVGGVIGGLAQVLIFRESSVVGASGGLFAVFIALATLLPNQVITMLLMFIIPIRTSLKKMAFFLVGVDVVWMLLEEAGLLGSAVGVAHLAHLGGAATGFLYVKYFLKNSVQRDYDRRNAERQRARFGGRTLVDAEVVESSEPSFTGRRPSFRGEKPSYVSADVDAILDKISAEGMHSLTPEERQILEDSSEQIARRTGGQR